MYMQSMHVQHIELLHLQWVYDSMGIVINAGVGIYSWIWGLHVHIGCTCTVCCLHVGCLLRVRRPAVVLKTADSLTPAAVIIISKQ